VIREAIRKEGMVAIGKVVFTSREHIIALEGAATACWELRFAIPYEVRNENEYFDGIADEKVPKDMLDLATHIVNTKKGKFEPQKFEDQYEGALKELLRKKQKGERIERPSEPAHTILQAYAHYYNEIRTHRSLEKDAPAFRTVQRLGDITSHTILGGLHHHYVRI
jgi:Ku protein